MNGNFQFNYSVLKKMNGDFQLNNCDNDNRIELINTALLIRPINKLSTIT